ncbi:MAG: hypothetical protein ACPLXC_01465 [Candidatus Pacearchaeota archaeon]
MAAASHALSYKEKNPEAKDKEVMQVVINPSENTIKSVGEIK